MEKKWYNKGILNIFLRGERKMKKYKLEKSNRLIGSITILIATILLSSIWTGKMAWATQLPTLLMLVTVCLPFVLFIGGMFYYFSK